MPRIGGVPGSSSDDSSDDEQLKLLQSVVDSDFIFQKTDVERSREKVALDCEQKNKPVEGDTNKNQDQANQNDLNISENVQKFLWKKLSKIIDESVEFYDDPNAGKQKRKKITENNDTIRIFSKNTSDSLNGKTLTDKQEYPRKHKIIEDNSEVLCDNDKYKLSSISSDYILSNVESQFCKPRKRSKLYKYKRTKDGKLIPIT